MYELLILCIDAVKILMKPTEPEDDVSIVFLYAFSSANMVVSTAYVIWLYSVPRKACIQIQFYRWI